MKKEVLRLEHIYKADDDTTKLNNLSLTVYRGETLGILGLNGSGKTMLADYLCGNVTINSGKVYFCGNKIEPCNRLDALNPGIFYLNNKTLLVPTLTVADCFYIMPSIDGLSSFKHMLYNKKKALRKAQGCLDELGISIDARTPAYGLSLAEQHMISIATAYFYGAKLIVTDTISNNYSTRETELIRGIFKAVTNRGMSILMLTHNVEYAAAMSDRIALIKNGSIIKVLPDAHVDPLQLLNMLLGKSFVLATPHSHTPDASQNFIIDDLMPLQSAHLRLCAAKGEIVGVYDYGNELCEELNGMLTSGTLKKPITGECFGTPFRFNTIQQALAHGIGIMFEDVLDKSVFNNMSLSDNLTMLIMDHIISKGTTFINEKYKEVLLKDYGLLDFCERNETLHKQNNLGVHETQRMVLCKWLIFRPRALICIKPFSHLDITLKNTSCEYFDKMAKNGTTIFLISSDYSILSPICDRVLFVSGKTIRSALSRDELIDIPSVISRIDLLV